MSGASPAARFRALFRRRTEATAYMPEVDGIRFLAILAVFFQHALFAYEGTHGTTLALPGRLRNLAVAGSQGVLLFFALSGFILALPFARHALAGAPAVRLRPYFLRRLIRLEPPYLIALLVLLLYKCVVQHQRLADLAPHLAASAGYVHNLVYGRPSAVLLVAWSLEVEVQFYLLAPLIFRLFRCPAGIRRLLFAVLGAGAVALRLRLPGLPPSLLDHLQYFMGGVLVADLWASGWRPPRGRGWAVAGGLLFAGTLGVLFTLPAPEERPLAVACGAVPLTALVLGLGLFCRPVRRRLSGGGVAAIGGMCYSLYLLHYLVLGVLADYSVGWFRLAAPALDFLAQLGLYAVAVLVGCGVFYLAVERPFMGWKVGVLRRRPPASTASRRDGRPPA